MPGRLEARINRLERRLAKGRDDGAAYYRALCELATDDVRDTLRPEDFNAASPRPHEERLRELDRAGTDDGGA